MDNRIVIEHPTKKETRTGKDLQVVLTYARHEGRGVRAVRVFYAYAGGITAHFTFNDGATAKTKWASWRVLGDWLRSRRAWGLINIYGNGNAVLHRYHGLAGAKLTAWQRRERKNAGILVCPCGCGGRVT